MMAFDASSVAVPGVAGLPDSLRLPLAFDPALLAADLVRLEVEDWTPHYVPDNYTGDWNVLPLRYACGAVHPILRAATSSGTNAWEDSALLSICPAVRGVLDALHCPIASVRLMRLAAGSVIHEHSDHDLAAEHGTARLHVPVLTNDDIDFRLRGARVSMRAGEMWYLRLSEPHSVANRGARDRVHLVIDATVNAWLAGVLIQAASLPAGED